jgi:hypothetical protein
LFGQAPAAGLQVRSIKDCGFCALKVSMRLAPQQAGGTHFGDFRQSSTPTAQKV